MNADDVKRLSRIYEYAYARLDDAESDLAFYAINNALIYAYMHHGSDSFLQGVEITNIDFENDGTIELLTKEFSKPFYFEVKETNTNYYEMLCKCIETFNGFFENNSIVNPESILGHVLEKHINQKPTGSYYTPDDTTEYIAWNTIIYSLLKKIDKRTAKVLKTNLAIDSFAGFLNMGISCKDVLEKMTRSVSKSDAAKIMNTIYSLKIIDPTCGSGAFIMSAISCIEYLANCLDCDVDQEKMISCFFGVDISREAIQLTKMRMLLHLKFESEKVILDFSEKFDTHFYVADALIGSDYVITEDGFDWKTFNIKFDCVVGNPPYVEKSGYCSSNFTTQKCGNLYANVIERSCNIVADDGIVSLIVPLSFVATPRMLPAKQYLENRSSSVFYSTFADRPGCVFSGVHQRLTIFFAEFDSEINIFSKVYTSKYNFWYNAERAKLFRNIRYYSNDVSSTFLKIGEEKEETIFKKLTSGKNSISDLICENSEFPVYMSTRIGFWSKAFLENHFSSNEYKVLYCKDKFSQYLLAAILNSSTFYYLWVITSDCWHVCNSDLSRISFNVEKIKDADELILAVDNLMEDLEKNKKYIGSKQTEFEYKHKYSKQNIDYIDDLLYKAFGLTKKECEYIKSYTEKYRVNTLEGVNEGN